MNNETETNFLFEFINKRINETFTLDEFIDHVVKQNGGVMLTPLFSCTDWLDALVLHGHVKKIAPGIYKVVKKIDHVQQSCSG